ncbi:MAG: hypothetical protein JXQ29_14105 [Planctomycetes bacterium]|nr:hypothetical protein [Planctomycetota bacterium]
MKSIAVVVFAWALGGLAAAQPAGDEERSIRWVASFEAATRQAAQRNVPILVAVVKEHDAASEPEKRHSVEQMLKVVYPDPDVVAVARRFVCVIVSLGWKPREGGEARFLGRLTEKQNEELEGRVRETCFPSVTDIVTPQHLILDASGKVLDRFLLTRTPEEFARLLKNALARFRGETPVDAVTADSAQVVSGLKDRDPEVQAAAFRQALALLGQDRKDPAVQDAAAQYLRNLKGHPALRRAIEAIDLAGTEGALELLVPHLRHRNAAIRARVLDVLAGAPALKIFLKPLAQCASSELELAPLRTLVVVLDSYADSFPEALSLLNRLVSHKEDSIKVLATFAAARPANEEVYGKLLARARVEPVVAVRVAGILGLARMKAVKALPALEGLRAREQKEPQVTAALDAAIASLGGTVPESAAALEKEIRKVRREAGATDDDERSGGGRKAHGRKGGRGKGR